MMTRNSWKFFLLLSLLLLLGGQVRVQAQTLAFQPKADYPTAGASSGLHPLALAVGDLNGDTYPDIVTANSNSNNISVFLNKGDGTFFGAVNYSIGNTPRSLVLADLNGDGKLDVAVANNATGLVAVRFGVGDGTFLPISATYLVGGVPYTIAVGDVNNDGLPDLVTAGGAGVLSVLLNNGSGLFQPALNTTIDPTTGLVLADFDGDGKLDVASSSTAFDRITVQRGRGNGGFDFVQFCALPLGGALALRAADLDNDTHLDLLTADGGNGLAGRLSFRKGTTAGDFTGVTDTTLSFIPLALELGDLDGDGKPDVILANGAQNRLAIGRGNGDGSFQPTQDFATASLPNGIAVGDFNKDGRLDIVTANNGSNSISVLINATPAMTHTLSGRILLQQTASSAVPLTFTFHPQDGSPIFTRSVTPASNGDYTLDNIPSKVYTVGIKGTKWLRVSLAADAVAGNATGLNATLRGGDANEDNVVDISDLILLIVHYNQMIGGDYLEAADFNNDGSCDITDLIILISNYNTIGSP